MRNLCSRKKPQKRRRKKTNVLQTLLYISERMYNTVDLDVVKLNKHYKNRIKLCSSHKYFTIVKKTLINILCNF